MKAAFVYCGDRIAPVFDVAQQVYLVETTDGNISSQTRQPLTDGSVAQKALRLSELNVDVLVCGAISRQLCELVRAYGIQVISFVAGKLDEIVNAWITGKLDADVYAMPGCCRRRRAGFKDTRSKHRQNCTQKRSVRRSANTNRYCVCLKCGHLKPHQPGQPCNGEQCPECGFPMSRDY
jgi:predicted Fe-Mo cluster-binding NifX family protein